MNRMQDPFELNRSEKPPGPDDVYWVECLKGDDKQKFLIYSPEVQGVSMHWRPSERKTVPCFENTALCPGGHSEKTRKWRCYVFAFSYKRHKNVFIQLTRDAWQSWLSQVRSGQNLRGSTIYVCRSAKDNGRLWIEVETWREDRQKDLPQNQDCKPSLFSLWKFEPADVMANAKIGSEPGFSKNGSVFA